MERFDRTNGKKFIFCVGQSNTFVANEFGVAPTITGPLDLRVKTLGQIPEKEGVVIPAGISSIDYGPNINTGSSTGPAYAIGSSVRKYMDADELLIVSRAVGGTSFSSGHWRGDGILKLESERLLRLVSEKGYECVGIFWFLGETDVIHAGAWDKDYGSQLFSLISTFRSALYQGGQKSAYEVPFITFDFHPEWRLEASGSTSQAVNIQNVLTNVGNLFPFAGNASTENLSPSIDDDVIHYDSRQSIELGYEMFEAWKKVLLLDRSKILTDYKIPAGEHIVYRQNYPALFTNRFASAEIGDSPEDDLYSRIGEIWKYEKKGKFHFRLEMVVDGENKFIEFEQSGNPYTSVSSSCAGSLLDFSPGLVWGLQDETTNTGFSGLTLIESNNAVMSLIGKPSNNAFVPIIQVGNFAESVGGPGVAPISSGADGNTVATEIVLKAIV